MRDRLIDRLSSPQAQFSRARKLSAGGSHRRALPLLSRAAQSGLPAAQRELGRAYLFALGVPSHLASALHWLGRAALAGDAEAQTSLAGLALMGFTHSAQGIFDGPAAPGAADYRAAAHWAGAAAAAGSGQAQALLGFIHDEGPDELRDPDLAESHYRRAAESGSPQGQLGWAISMLRRTSDSDAQARAWALIEAASSQNLPTAHYAMALHHLDRAEPDRDAAIGHLRAGAAAGHTASQFRLGLALRHDADAGALPVEAETWLRRAALGGETQAAALLGDSYAAQDGALPPNVLEAALWYRHGAEAGHAGCARALARLHLGGPSPDIEQAAAWLRRAAALGDNGARDDFVGFALARLVPDADQAASFAWLAERAEAGDVTAQYRLGLCLANGIGTQRDDGRALACFRGASVELPEAAFWSGRMIAEGRGAPCDESAARAFYLAGAERGQPDAQAAAGEMLLNGRGGVRDPALAHTLFKRAAAAGHAGAAYALRVIAAAANPS